MIKLDSVIKPIFFPGFPKPHLCYMYRQTVLVLAGQLYCSVQSSQSQHNYRAGQHKSKWQEPSHCRQSNGWLSQMAHWSKAPLWLILSFFRLAKRWSWQAPAHVHMTLCTLPTLIGISVRDRHFKTFSLTGTGNTRMGVYTHVFHGRTMTLSAPTMPRETEWYLNRAFGENRSVFFSIPHYTWAYRIL